MGMGMGMGMSMGMGMGMSMGMGIGMGMGMRMGLTAIKAVIYGLQHLKQTLGCRNCDKCACTHQVTLLLLIWLLS
jgi:hypothetical protein